MQVYINIDDNSDNNKPQTETGESAPKVQDRIIKLHSNIPEDEDFGL